MSQITLVYHFKSYYPTLENSLKSLIAQNDQNFDVILFDDNASEKTSEIINSLNLTKKFPNVQFITSNHALGHTYCFNFALEKYIRTPYVYFVSPTVVYQPNFVNSINQIINEKNNFDIIAFDCKGVYPKELNEINLGNKSKVIFPFFTSTYTNKIYSVSFLKKNQLKFVSFHHYTMLWAYQTFFAFQSLKIIHEPIAKMEAEKSTSYDLYDLIRQIPKMWEISENNELYANNLPIFQYIDIRLVLYRFLTAIYRKFIKKDKDVIKTAIEKAINFLDESIPNWQRNKFLISKNNPDHKDIVNYIKEFKPNIRYIDRFYKKFNHGNN